MVQYKKMVGLKPNDVEFDAMSEIGMKMNNNILSEKTMKLGVRGFGNMLAQKIN